MKEQTSKNIRERGQVLPIVALILVFALMAMVVLIVDGGALFSNKRTAQAAADAGALAGARVLCSRQPNAQAVAVDYATNKNFATSAIATILGRHINVEATVERNSFFAGFLGKPTLKTVAEAEAGCFAVAGKSVVPLAWNCRAPTVGGGPFDPNMGCQIQTLSWKLIGPLVDPYWEPVSERVSSVSIKDSDGNFKTYTMSNKYIHSPVDSDGRPAEQIYIIIDSDKICREDDPLNGVITCDLDGDGKKEIQTGGDRGWLYLTADTSNIANWIKSNGAHPDFSMDSHKWLSGKSGNDVSVYDAMIKAAYPGQIVLVPVYNTLCPGDPRTDAQCVADAHASPWDPEPAGGDDFSQIRQKNTNYHIVTFEPFYVACVDKKGDCPGLRFAQTLLGGNNLKDIPVMEGYFLTDVDVSPDITQDCTINLGNCTISLSK
ncbi:MAG: pilus assembly protein TadG-related protein [Anaerolineaceae bacterium]